MYYFQERHPFDFQFLSPFAIEVNSESKFFLLRVDPLLEGLYGGTKQKVT